MRAVTHSLRQTQSESHKDRERGRERDVFDA